MLAQHEKHFGQKQFQSIEFTASTRGIHFSLQLKNAQSLDNAVIYKATVKTDTSKKTYVELSAPPKIGFMVTRESFTHEERKKEKTYLGTQR